jgi:Zn-dependent protease with chaperone function
MRLAVAIGMALLLAACAQNPAPRSSLASTSTGDQSTAEPEEQLEPASAADWARTERVALAVFRGGRELCRQQVAPALGFFFASDDSFDPAANVDGFDVDDLGDRYEVTRIVGGSPAAQAGLQVGDILVSLAGQPVPQGPGTAEAALRLGRQVARDGQPLALTIERDGAQRPLSLTPVLACDIDLIVQRSWEINAYTNGSLIQVRSGLLRFIESDDELALVLAHEVGHSIMNHAAATKITMIGGAIVGGVVDAIAGDAEGTYMRSGIAAGSRRNSVAHELQADYIGLYVMARAGYDIGVAGPLWRRMAEYMPDEVSAMPTHPAPPARIAAIERTVAEIRAKQASGAPLVPDAATVARLGREPAPSAAN